MEYKILLADMRIIYSLYCGAVKAGDFEYADKLETKYTALYNKKQKYDEKNMQREEIP